MMQFGIYGTKGSLISEFTDNEPGQVRVVLDKLTGHKQLVSCFDAERDASAYGHGATVIRYMRHFSQECLDNDHDPLPGVVDGAKSVSAGVAACKSVYGQGKLSRCSMNFNSDTGLEDWFNDSLIFNCFKC